MWDIAPDHAPGLIAGLVMLPMALVALFLRRSRRRVPGTVQAASVMMAVAGAIHLGLVPSHLEEPLSAVLFVLNGIAYLVLSQAFTWRWWRIASASLITATLLGYLLWIAIGLDQPDQVALTTKLVELTALGLVIVPVRGRAAPRDPASRWALLVAGLPLFTMIVGGTVWAIDIRNPDAAHAHLGAILQSTNEAATPEQVAAAQRLYDDTAAAIAPYRDWHAAWAAGYRPTGSTQADSTHWINEAYVKAGYVLDPQRPQGLVYANTHHGPVLLGAMFQMKKLGDFGPDPGGPLTAWHQHLNICFTPLGLGEFSLMTPFATCPLGAIDISAPAMLHVWIVDNPQGGRFAVDIDPDVVRRIDRS